ncbi:MAG: methanogenesis marker 2 protein [Deltaproteobacteria bacterium]|nr:methanogenesis marker 2 protein [Deltaproteobacteria bacterium]
MLKDIIAQIRSYPGLTRKRDIYRITNILQTVTDFGDTVADFGEDAAAIYYNGEYLLLAVDGIWSGLLDANPYGAGKAAVMASVNDIYAMGGRPLAMVNVIGAAPDGSLDEIVRGIRKGCEKFRVPMVGGHLHPDTGEQQLSVAIMGRAARLLRSNNAVPEQDIMFAVDLDGKGYQCRPVLSWDTNSGKKTPQILERLEVLPQLAESKLCSTAKDVSNAGVLGTIALMMETSETGAHIDIDSIPKPESFSLIDWLKAFLSYGFVLCVDKQKSAEVAAMFTAKNITAAVIGTVLEQRIFTVGYQGACETLFDFEKEDVTGIARDYGLQNMPV